MTIPQSHRAPEHLFQKARRGSTGNWTPMFTAASFVVTMSWKWPSVLRWLMDKQSGTFTLQTPAQVKRMDARGTQQPWRVPQEEGWVKSAPLKRLHTT